MRIRISLFSHLEKLIEGIGCPKPEVIVKEKTAVNQVQVAHCSGLFVNGIFWCYAWDLQHRIVVIIDHSGYAQNDDALITRHSGTIHTLANALSSTVKGLFNGWCPSFSPSRIAVVRTGTISYNSIDTGLVTLFCIRNFDGKKLVVDPTEANLNSFRSSLLYELMQIKNNGGSYPSGFV